MKHWNFHNYIALPLEEYGKTHIGSSCKTADEIECGEFVDAMFSILLIKFGSLNEFPEFVARCNDYTNIPASKVPKEEAIELFSEFKRLVNLKTIKEKTK